MGISAMLLGSTSVPAAAQEQDGGKAAWFLAALVQGVGTTLIGSLSQGTGCVFSNLLNKMGFGMAPSYNCANNAMATNNAPMNTQFTPQGTPVMNTQFTPQGAAVVATQPVLSFVIQKLSSNQPNAQVLETLASSSQAQGGTPTFNIQTGESFAVMFSTSVPGRVRLISTDVDKVVSTSSLYEAIPGGDNRMPRAYEGGMRMEGRPGLEFVEFEFVPCISQALSQHPAVAPFAGTLPACSTAVATKQYTPALPDGKGGLADMGGKAIVFPTNGDPSQPVGIAPTDFVKGDSLRLRVNINHTAPGGQGGAVIPPTPQFLPGDPNGV